MARSACTTEKRPAHTSRTPLIKLISMVLSVRRSRKDLGRLDRNALHDIGLTPEEAAQEAARPLWDVPPNWRH